MKPYKLSAVTLPALVLAVVGLANCSAETHPDGTSAGGTSSEAAGEAGAGASGAPDAEGGEGGAAGAAGAPCTEISGEYRHDANVGPGCVSLGTATILDGKFTIEPGTTIQVQRGGSLEVSGDGTLSALGTAELPIVFTSAEDSPAAGDWKCIMLDADAPDSALDHVRLEYGGSSCGSSASSLLVVSGVDQLTHLEIHESAGHALRLLDSARGIRQLHDLKFSAVEKTSLLVTPEAMNALRPPIVLDKDDKYIDVDSGALGDVEHEVTWHNVDLPYRFDSDVDIWSALTIEPGTTLAPTGMIWVTAHPAAVITALGTAEAPIRWTSVEPTPAPGDWGCIDFTQEKTSRFEFNEFEYGGSCSYGGHQQVLLVEVGASVAFRDLSFSHLPDVAILKAFGCPSDSELTEWCGFHYEAVKDPVYCDLSLACK